MYSKVKTYNIYTYMYARVYIYIYITYVSDMVYIYIYIHICILYIYALRLYNLHPSSSPPNSAAQRFRGAGSARSRWRASPSSRRRPRCARPPRRSPPAAARPGLRLGSNRRNRRRQIHVAWLSLEGAVVGCLKGQKKYHRPNIGRTPEKLFLPLGCPERLGFCGTYVREAFSLQRAARKPIWWLKSEA